MPIAYMTVVDGWAHTAWGAGGMLYTEAAAAFVAIGIFYGVAVFTRTRAAASAASHNA
jgi:hypothetical protein